MTPTIQSDRRTITEALSVVDCLPECPVTAHMLALEKLGYVLLRTWVEDAESVEAKTRKAAEKLKRVRMYKDTFGRIRHRDKF